MAKVRGPILSIGASGSIAKSQVYASWRGVQYARQHVVPSNPRTADQQITRGVFGGLQELYRRLPLGAQEPWQAAVSGRPLTARNAFTSLNVKALRGKEDMAGFVGSPGARGGLALSDLRAVTGASPGSIDVAFELGAGPSGWVLESVDLLVMRDRDPVVTPTDWPVLVRSQAPAVDVEVNKVVDGLVGGITYVISGWSVWERPDGRRAYGPSLTVTAAASAEA